MKKVILIFFFLALFVTAGAFAQSLQNNEYYRQSVEYTRLSEQAFEAGEYDQSVEYSIKAQEYAELSRKYIAEMVLAYRARTALTAAKERMELADRLNIKGRDSELYAEALAFFQSATEKFSNKEYEGSIPDSQKVIELLKDIAPAPRQPALAATYEVKLRPERRDCLWRIAEFDFVYGDPYKWPLLYEANKDTFPEPDNPHLIEPGMILKIPSVRGEARSGQR